MKPETYVRRSRSFRPDLIAGIFDLDLMLFQMRERPSQDRHVRQMKRHVLDRLRRRLPLEQCDRNPVVPDRYSVFEFKFLAQPDHALPPPRALLRIAHRQPKMAHNAESKWSFCATCHATA